MSKKGLITSALYLKIAGKARLNKCDQIRTHMFCMACEKVSQDINRELTKEIFEDEFAKNIVNEPAYLSFSSFCLVDREGLFDIGSKVFDILSVS